MATGLYRLDIRGNLAGQYRENVIHMQGVGITAVSPWNDAKEVLVAWNATFKSLWLDMLPPDYQLDAVVARQLGPVTGPYHIFDYQDGAEVGQAGTEAVSEQLCPCITLIPTLGVKSAGRIFLPAVDKADYQLNVPTSGFKTRVTAFVNAMIAGVTFLSGTVSIGIYSRKLNTMNNDSTYSLSPLVGYQRRRARPVGV